MQPSFNTRKKRFIPKVAYSTILSLWVVALFPLAAVNGQDSGRNREQTNKPKTIAVLGSSVASGWVTSYEKLRDLENGYAYRLERLLEPRGWKVVNVSIPGDDTKKVLRRMDRDLARIDPGFVLIGLSMSNEGLETEDPDKVIKSYTQGLKKIIKRCRNNNMTPIVGLCYANDNFTLTQYAYIKKMNRLINTWDVPSINLLGPLDDGNGRFLKGFTFDLDHPDDRGHEEMFYAIVPTLFDALAEGKPIPPFGNAKRHTTIDKPKPGAPVSFIPDDVMHSFAYIFDVRTSSEGRLATIHGTHGAITVEMDDQSRMRIMSGSGEIVLSKTKVSDGTWHQVAISHQYLRGRTEFFIDGVSIGEINEKLVPLEFVLGGDRRSVGAKAGIPADYRQLLVYRASLNSDEVKSLYKGKSLQASLEVFAPLSDEQLDEGVSLANIAQSNAQLFAYPQNNSKAVERLSEKIKAAAKHKQITDPNAKKPMALSPSILESYMGVYQMGGSMKLIITYEDGRLLFSPNGEGRTQLYAESEKEFFMKIFIRGVGPNFKMGITFVEGKSGSIDELVFHQGSANLKAKRVKGK